MDDNQVIDEDQELIEIEKQSDELVSIPNHLQDLQNISTFSIPASV